MNPEPATDTPPTILAGLLNREQLQSQMGWSIRTVFRRENAGMPFVRVGLMRLYDPAKVREWLLSHESRRDVPKVGRPRSKRVA